MTQSHVFAAIGGYYGAADKIGLAGVFRNKVGNGNWDYVLKELETFSVLAIGKRLGLLLFVIAVYCVAVGLIIQWWDISVLDWGSAVSLINTVILGLLMSFRNRAAYDRWWDEILPCLENENVV